MSKNETTKSPRKTGEMTINLPGVIKTLSESLYSDPGISLRELLQNANDTCVVRQSLDQNAPPSEIHVRFDSWKRRLVITDNGAGLTEDEVKQFLTIIGNSYTSEVRLSLEEMGRTDKAQQLIGRFGLGLLATFIIGDRVEFITRSYKTRSKALYWECDGGQEYRMGPAENKKVPVGTTVTVHVNPKHVGLLRDDKLKELIHLYADFLQIPIYLDPLPGSINIITAPWDFEGTETEYREFVVERYPDDAVLDIIRLEISEDNGSFQIGGALFIPKQPLFIVREHGDVRVYVRRMFICEDERDLLPDWAKFVKGIVCSPNLQETTSRESLIRDENFDRVQKTLGRIILNYLTRVSQENFRLFKEIVTNHNLVIKAWALASDELFDTIKNIVLFQTDAGLLNLQRYFETSRFARQQDEIEKKDGKQQIFYFTTPGGAGQHSVLFSARGLRVIDASRFPDDGFLRKYADKHDNIILRRLDISGGFIFEELERRTKKWVEMEEIYADQRIDAKVVRFVPEDIPAVLIYPETEPLSDQVDTLLSDPNLSQTLKSLLRQLWEDRERDQKGKLARGGILYLNANSPVIKKLIDLDLNDYEVQDVMIVIYNNALMLSTQGAKMALTPENAKRVFDGNNRAIASLMDKIYEVRELRQQKLTVSIDQIDASEKRLSSELKIIPQKPDIELAGHIVCFTAFPHLKEDEVIFRAVQDVLEAPPYYWEVVRVERPFFIRKEAPNLIQRMDPSHCYFFDVTENTEEILMLLGHVYWRYPERAIIITQREGMERRLGELVDVPRAVYPWEEPPNHSRIFDTFKRQFAKMDLGKKLQGKYHFLSPRCMQTDWISQRLAEAISLRYKTVEDFVGQDPSIVSRKIGKRLAREGVVKDIQGYLHDQLKQLAGTSN